VRELRSATRAQPVARSLSKKADDTTTASGRSKPTLRAVIIRKHSGSARVRSLPLVVLAMFLLIGVQVQEGPRRARTVRNGRLQKHTWLGV